jgi:ADP-dependent phosphofructokinase/glucokinase
MIDDVYKEFFTDHQTNRVLNTSEVWRNYSQAEMARDVIRQKRAVEEKLDQEHEILSGVEQFRQKVANDPALKEYFKKAAAVLKQHPELKDKVDPNFLNGLSLLDLESED